MLPSTSFCQEGARKKIVRLKRRPVCEEKRPRRSINTEVPMNVTLRSDETLNGTINGGGCRMELVNANGGVTITGE
jgi:hypothetical protein